MAVKAANANDVNGRVSLGELERFYVAGREMPKVVKFGEDERTLEITVVQSLGVDDTMRFVKSVVDTVFGDEDTYYAGMKYVAVVYATAYFFTNMTLPNNTSLAYEMLIKSGIYDKIVSEIDHERYALLLDAVDDQIDYEVSKRMATAKKEVDQAIQTLTHLQENYEAFMDSVQKLAGPDIFELAQRLKSSANNIQSAIQEQNLGGNHENSEESIGAETTGE